MGWRMRESAPRAKRSRSLGTRSARHGVAGAGGGRVGFDVEQEPLELGSRHTVDGRVVDLDLDGDVPVGQALDEVELPQGPCPVEMARRDAGDLLGELVVVAGGGQGQVAHVEVEVEIRVLDPQRVVHPEGDLDHPTAQRREQVQRDSTRSRTRSKVRPPSTVVGSSTDTLPTWP